MELWEDKEIRFDLSFSKMKTRNGEHVIDKLDFIEDTKGNSGDKGRLLITNLRIIWHSLSIAKISLSIGYNCIQNVSTKVVNSRLKGVTEALHILTKYHNARYEFIFANLIPGNFRHFTSVMAIHKAYTSSRLYRELQLRGAIIRNKQLRTLEKEKIYFNATGIWNLSSDQGNLGIFVVTNIRLVWFADMNETFNVSLPFIQIASIRIRESKFGPALVIESSLESGGYVLGFRIDPSERLRKITQELQSFHKIHFEHPEFGVHYVISSLPLLAEEPPIMPEEITEFDDSLNDLSNGLISYTLDNSAPSNGGQTIYSPELGLAIEKLKDGYTLDSLWEVIPSNI